MGKKKHARKTAELCSYRSESSSDTCSQPPFLERTWEPLGKTEKFLSTRFQSTHYVLNRADLSAAQTPPKLKP